MNKPLISIITVVYNGARTIERTIQSVCNQTYENIEYIIIDGNSTDNTLEIVKKFNCINKLISEPDAGIYDAMNKGISLAKGDYIALLNSDDWYEPDTCEIVANRIMATGKDVYYGLERVVSLDNTTEFIYGYTMKTINNFMIAHPTCFVSKNIYKKYLYDLRYKSAADYDFFLKIKDIASFEFIEQILANFSLCGMSDSFLGKLESIQIRHKYNVISKIDYFAKLFYYKINILINK